MKKRFALVCPLAMIGLAAGLAAAEPSPLRRRAEFRRELDSADPARAARLRLADRDPVIRRGAAFGLSEKLGGRAFDALKTLGGDPDAAVRLIVVNSAIDAKTPEAHAYLKQASANDPDARVRGLAAKAVWPFHRKVLLLKDDPTWDHEIVIVRSIVIPDAGWLFALDPAGDGHLQRFFAADFDDAGWTKIVRSASQSQPRADDGALAWYRIRFDMPPKIPCNAVEFEFHGLEEPAWVWLNGIYLGERGAALQGGSPPLRLSATREIVWGGRNVLAVRVLSGARGGALVGPIRVEILK